MRVVLALAAGGCARDWCGPGTVEMDRQCVPVEETAPAPTEPAPPSLLCGPGTVEADGYCVVEEVVPDCGYGTVVRGDSCVALDVQWIRTPFADGARVPVSQGHHGYFSHSGASVYAVDWVVPEGTEVVAARAGKVVEVYEASDTGCGDAACANLANFVVIDHGDATFGQYWHLRQDGALVEVGDLVGQGQVIALSGNTGWSTGPHLHLQIRDALGQSLPLYFEDQPDTDGQVFAGASFESGNTPQPAPADFPWSTCPADLFTFMGVTLGPGVPCARVGSEAAIAADARIDGSQVVVAAWSTVQGQWGYTCTGTPAFSGAVPLPSGNYQGYTYLMVGAANQDCFTYQGWDSSVYLPIGG